MFPRVVLAWATLGFLACSNELGTQIAVTADCATGPEVTLHWAITAGECGIRPGAIELAGMVGAVPPTVLGSGEHCVWALAVDDACRVVAGTSASRTLPEGRGTVRLELDEDSCVAADQRASWDPLVLASADCTPSCEPERCACGGAGSCAGDTGYCPAPLDGDLLESSSTLTCVARLGASEVSCWAEGANDGLPFTVPTPSAVEELAVGRNFVCYLGPSDDAAGSDDPARSSVRCSRAMDGGLTGWRPVDRSSDCLANAPANMVLRGIEAGANRVCAFASVSGSSGIACWGSGPWNGSLGTQVDDCATGADDVEPGPLFFRLPSGSRWLDLAVGDASVCALRLSGEVECLGAGAPDVDALTLSPGQAFESLVMAGDVLCARATNGIVSCTTAGIVDDSRWVDFDFAQVAGRRTFCGSRADGTYVCSGPGDIPTELRYSAMAVTDGNVCALTADGVSGVACYSTSVGAAPVGTAATTEGQYWVCPDE